MLDLALLRELHRQRLGGNRLTVGVADRDSSADGGDRSIFTAPTRRGIRRRTDDGDPLSHAHQIHFGAR